MNILDSIRRMVRTYPGGVEAVAPRLANKTASTLEKELRGAPGFKLGAIDAAEISAMCYDIGTDDALAYATALAAQFGCLLVPLPPVLDVQNGECMKALAQMSRESAETIAEGITSLADGRVTDNELQRFDRCLSELMSAGQSVRSAMAAVNQAGKPQGES